MATGFDLIKELAERAQGRNPAWVSQAAYTGAPSSAVSGIDVEDAIVALVSASPRREVHNHMSRVTVTTNDLTLTTYTVTIDATPVAYDASASLPATGAALLTGIADAINANGTVNLLVFATVEDLDGDGLAETIVIRNITGEANTHTTAIGVAAGTGAMAFDEDATGMTLRLFCLPVNNTLVPPLPWVMANNADAYVVDYRGFTERFEIPGVKRLYIEAHTVTGPASPSPNPTIAIATGPCEVES
jgi:hypothetical protein